MNKDNGGIPKHSTKYDREMNWEGMKIQQKPGYPNLDGTRKLVRKTGVSVVKGLLSHGDFKKFG